MLKERLGEHFAETEIGEHCFEGEIWGNTLLRERLGEHCAEGEIVGTLCLETD